MVTMFTKCQLKTFQEDQEIAQSSQQQETLKEMHTNIK